jgi:hypothetical protein
MSYDQRCRDLAEAFLRDCKTESDADAAHHADQLAQHIQDSI